MDSHLNNEQHVVILGGGLAGLTAAQQLSYAGYGLTVLEHAADVGGLARTIEHNGFRFDLGGHRFVTHNQQLEDFVRRLLGDDCLSVSRSSKILLHGRYFDYPFKPGNAVSGFGLLTSAAILFDYGRERLAARFGKQRTAVSLQDWVIQQFGRRLFDIYFRDYSEKVWGIDCQQIDMHWVAQRIQGLSLGQAIKTALTSSHVKSLPTLSQGFLYPKQGIGQIAAQLAGEIRQYNPIFTQSRVTCVHHTRGRITRVDVQQNDFQRTIKGQQFISTIPLQALIKAMRPLPPAQVLSAATRLRSRDLVTVALMVNREQITDHTWIYTPEKAIPFGRLHEPSNWSRAMAPDKQSLLVAEYFCFRGDHVWAEDNASLIEQTIVHLQRLGLIQRHEIIDAVVTRIANAYPLFEVGYLDHCQTIYDYLDRFDNLHTAGRGGMFRYYNMDHTMQAGLDAAQAIMQSTVMTPPSTGVYA